MPNINHKNKYDCENSHSNNLWQYKRTTDYIGWDKMKDFPGNSKIGAIAFVIENKAYVGLGRSQLNGTVYLCFGHNAHEYSRDVYKFNPEVFRLDAAPPYWYCCRYNYLTDEWEEAPPMPRTHPYVTTFTKDNAGYVIFNDIAYKFVY